MKKLVLLLSALLVLSSFASSPVLAARPSVEYRFQSFLATLYQYVFPLSGVYWMPGDFGPGTDGSGNGSLLGGDADDYGNGRSSDVTQGKPKGVANALPGPEENSRGKGISTD
jgi:hypothetical protein